MLAVQVINGPACPLDITFEGMRKMTLAITLFLVECHRYAFVSFFRARSCLLEEKAFDFTYCWDEDIQKLARARMRRDEAASQNNHKACES
jgi:hypothetical protein